MLDDLYSSIKASVIEWLPEIYSTKKGLYKLSASAFHPFSVDATSLGIDLHLMMGLEPPDLEESIKFFDQQQDDQTGFYHEPFVSELDLSTDRILEMSGTYFGYQVSAVLMALSRSPHNPYRFYEKFLVSEKMEDYMARSMPWDRSPMGAGNMVDHGAP